MPPLTRRTVLGQVAAGGAVLAVAGCSDDDGGTTPVRPRTRAQLTHDERAVVDLVERLLTTTAALPTIPPLARAFAGLLGTERAHLRELQRSATAGKLPVASPSSTPVPATRAGAIADARALRAAYVTHAEAAESGQFARLLASMGCAITQRLEELSK